MTDNIERLILERFRVLRNQIEGLQTEMRNDFSDVKHRINRIESAVAGIRRDEAGRTAEDIARQLLIGLRSKSIGLNIG
jgi:DNA-binding FrmR family transcriptional regulator